MPETVKTYQAISYILGDRKAKDHFTLFRKYINHLILKNK
jgi:hypothetical protein